MHALGKFVQELMDGRGWRQADLVKASGLTRAHVSQLLKGDSMGRMVKDRTLNGLTKAFPEVDRSVFVTKNLEAMGVVPEDLRSIAIGIEEASDEALIVELRRRLELVEELSRRKEARLGIARDRAERETERSEAEPVPDRILYTTDDDPPADPKAAGQPEPESHALTARQQKLLSKLSELQPSSIESAAEQLGVTDTSDLDDVWAHYWKSAQP